MKNLLFVILLIICSVTLIISVKNLGSLRIRQRITSSQNHNQELLEEAGTGHKKAVIGICEHYQLTLRGKYMTCFV